MTNNITNKSLSFNARIAGLLYLILAVTSAFGYYTFLDVYVAGNALQTIQNIADKEFIYRLGIVSSLIGQAAFILLAIALYQLFKEVDKIQAKILVVLVVASVPVAFVNILFQIAPLITLNSAEFSNALGQDAVNALMMFFLDLHKNGIIVVSIFWGLWLFPFGYLAFKSGFIPKLIGIILMVNCFAYLIDSFSFLLIPSYYEAITSVANAFMWIGEVSALLWLLIMGAKPKKA